MIYCRVIAWRTTPRHTPPATPHPSAQQPHPTKLLLTSKPLHPIPLYTSPCTHPLTPYDSITFKFSTTNILLPSYTPSAHPSLSSFSSSSCSSSFPRPSPSPSFPLKTPLLKPPSQNPPFHPLLEHTQLLRILHSPLNFLLPTIPSSLAPFPSPSSSSSLSSSPYPNSHPSLSPALRTP